MNKTIVVIILVLGILSWYPKQVIAEYVTKNKSAYNTKYFLNENKYPAISTDIKSKYSIKQNDDYFKFDKKLIFQDSISNIIGGTLFALFIFSLNEFIFRRKNLTGEWETNNKIDTTTWNSYNKITIVYKIHLLQSGTQITGRGEKIKDLNPDGSLFYEYLPEQRTEIEINGHYERNFLRRSKLYLLIKEYGKIRTSSTSYELVMPLTNRKFISGVFCSTASNSHGTSNWTRFS